MRLILPLLACLLLAAWFLDDAAGRATERLEPEAAAPAEPLEGPILVGRPGAGAATPAAAPEPAASDEELEDLESDTDVPPDPVETGPCLLIVTVHDDATRAIMDTQLDLWRLDAPDNEHWSRGDQRQTRVTTADGIAQIDDLPAGRYRVHAHGQRAGTSDLAEFEVSGTLTEVRLDLPGLREHRVFLKVFDERGNQITEGRLSHSGRGGSSSRGRVPDWIAARTRKDGVGDFTGFGGGGFRSGGSHRGGPRVTADANGFDLGLHKEDARYARERSYYELLVDGGTAAYVSVKNDLQRERTYQGLSLPLAYLHDRVFLPSGERAVDAGAFFYVRTESLLVTEETARDAWQHLTVEVSVQLLGYAPVELEFTLAGDDWTATLEPRSTTEPDG